MGCWPFKIRSDLSHLENSPVPASRDDHIVVSLFDYPPNGNPITHIGERLTVISDDGDFWMVRSTVTGRDCYISRHYAAKVIKRWMFSGISRRKAEELLLLPYNHTGAFLVRESQTNKDFYSLSVLWRDRHSGVNSVRHYLIGCLRNGWFYISPSLTFPTLDHLIEHYSDSADGLGCTLKEPCFVQGSTIVPEVFRPVPMTIRKPSLNWREVRRSMIFRKSKDHSEDSPLLSEGLRESITSYLYMTDTNCEDCTTDADP